MKDNYNFSANQLKRLQEIGGSLTAEYLEAYSKTVHLSDSKEGGYGVATTREQMKKRIRVYIEFNLFKQKKPEYWKFFK